MIVIDFPITTGSQAILKVSGHSGMAQHGRDVVCAAVSALVQTFAGGVEEKLEAQISGQFNTGDCNLKIRVPENYQKDLKIVCEVFRFGFQKIAQSYPEHVKLN